MGDLTLSPIVLSHSRHDSYGRGLLAMHPIIGIQSATHVQDRKVRR